MFDLSPYNTFNLKVHAKSGRVIKSIADLCVPIEDKFIILGGGSDVLFTENFAGTVLINRIQELSIEEYSELGYYKVRAGGGVLMDHLIEQLISAGITGLENLSLIPGTVGAAPIQNIGAYGVEIGDYIESIETVDLQSTNMSTPTVRIFSQQECQFAYRSSIFKQAEFKRYFITHVVFKLPKDFEPHLNYAGLDNQNLHNAKDIREKVIELRNAKLPDPKQVGNAGSFFKNPYVSADVVNKLKRDFAPQEVPCYKQEDGNYKLAAGWLIDKANCRGIQHGSVGTWSKQALVIVNLGEAEPHEVVDMAKYVSGEVKSKFGIDLIPEVRFYGKNGEQEWAQI